jgi:hypothetical protein
VEGLRLSPRPVQRPRIRIWIGGDWRHAGVRRRVVRWDGSCAYHVSTPDDVRDVLAAVERERGTSAGFDVKVGGERDLARVRALAAAGATWWNEWMPPAALSVTRRAMAAGPPGA